ncbi:MAG: hypothetical protein Q4C45_02665 [Oscillospiraceae bacterium]|nr:hypothetical protein [Oscillospiraceae bacterium]
MKKKPFSDARWWDNPCAVTSQCGYCKHYKIGTLSCKAFERIPKDILGNYVIHDHPVEGDHGILFEPTDPNVPKVKQRKKVMPYD